MNEDDDLRSNATFTDVRNDKLAVQTSLERKRAATIPFIRMRDEMS